MGRDAEIDRLHAFLTAARADGGALLVTGDPGVGQTELRSASDAAPAAGTRILRAAGVRPMSSSSGVGSSGSRPELAVLRPSARQRPDVSGDVDEEGR